MLQLELIERVRAVCRADPGLDAALMYGSFTKDEADEHSDIEFWLFFTKPARDRLDPAEWCARIAPVSYLIHNEFGTHVAFFPQLVRGEFHFATVEQYGAVALWPERGAPVDRMIVLDRSGRLERILSALPEHVTAPPPGPGAAVSDYCDRFVNWLTLTHHLVERGELLRACDALSHVQRHLTWMARIAEGSTGHWLTPSRAAEKELSARTIDGLVAATCAADVTALRAALRAALTEGRRHWETIGAPGPVALFDELSAALDAYHR